MRPTPWALIGYERFEGADDITNDRNMLNHGGVKVPMGTVDKMIYKDSDQLKDTLRVVVNDIKQCSTESNFDVVPRRT